MVFVENTAPFSSITGHATSYSTTSDVTISKYFSIENSEKVKESERTLYLMKKKG